MLKDFTPREKINLVRLCAGALVLATGIALERVMADNSFVPLVVFMAGFLALGGDVILEALKNIVRGQVFDENFLMGIATIGAFAIGEAPEAVGVMLFYQIGEFFQETAVKKSKKSIADLMDIRPDYANLKRGESIVKVAPDTVFPGEVIVVKPGEKIPLDGVVIEGLSMIDASALTGESVPKKANVTDTVLSGCVNQTGKLTIEVTKSFGESTVSKIINLVENAAGRKAKTENFITTFARYYTPVVVALAILLAVLPPLFSGGEWLVWIKRGLIFLVISCPCALVLSIPMGFFGGIGRAAKNGILVKGGNYLEAFNNLEIAVFDKTGTLTKGVFKVTNITSANGFSESKVLELAANAEAFSNHPIALSVMREYGKEADRAGLREYTEHPGYGISVVKDGKLILTGNLELMEKNGVNVKEPHNAETKAGTKVYIAQEGVFAGCIVISDEVKPDSHSAVLALKARGVKKTIMLTGDSPQIAQVIADELGLDEVYGGLLPHEKVEKLETLNMQKYADVKKGRKVNLAFVGDGINDAPVLAMADIGIAMGGLGSDAAIEAADVVLMTDEPSKLAEAMDIARFTKRIVRQNIVFALGVKGVFLVLGAFGIAGMWEAVFADVGVSVIAVFNAMRILGTATKPPNKRRNAINQ
jgi:Cd2+/Zn2+-exporting ATPase